MHTLLDDLWGEGETAAFVAYAFDGEAAADSAFGASDTAFASAILDGLARFLGNDILLDSRQEGFRSVRLPRRYRIRGDVNDPRTLESEVGSYYYPNKIHFTNIQIASVLERDGEPLGVASATVNDQAIIVSQIQGTPGTLEYLSCIPWREMLVDTMFRVWAQSRIDQGAIREARKNEWVERDLPILQSAEVYAPGEDPWSLEYTEEQHRICTAIKDGRLATRWRTFSPLQALRAYDRTAERLMAGGYIGRRLTSDDAPAFLRAGDFVFDLTRLPA